MSPLRDFLERYSIDRAGLGRYFSRQESSRSRTRMKRFLAGWREALQSVDFDRLNQAGQVDWILFRNLTGYQLWRIEEEERRKGETARLIPFEDQVVELEYARLKMEPIDSGHAAGRLHRLNQEIGQLHQELESRLAEQRRQAEGGQVAEPLGYKKTAANRAANRIRALQAVLKRWYEFYHGYDPLFTWWAEQPYEVLNQTLEKYVTFLRETVVGIKEDDPEAIIGDSIGREALLRDLALEMIPYTPEELVEIANRELAWCQAEMLKASRELGFGEDWKAALEHVKQLHVEPGRQPELIRDLALEAIRFLDERDLITIPDLARETWRMSMMSPERQLVAPFFLGGEVIRVSYPTNTMPHERKLMSMRGNNIHFSRATVHHELIPGHHLQGFMTSRYNTHRRPFSTPFWGEGWALYWEMQLWDMDFPRSPEDRIGMLFWRMHRCARIIFSLSFHLGTMTPQECIDFLVERVGHERENAAGEVRRSFGGDYSPLYQSAYMLGALQFRALHRELVGSGRMSNREFHDRILRENRIPVEMVRALLTGQRLSRDFRTSWRFYPGVASDR